MPPNSNGQPITLNSSTYVTAVEGALHLGDDVTPGLIRDWQRRGLVSPAGRLDGINRYRLEDLRQVERETRTSRCGRPRTGPPRPRSLPNAAASATIPQTARLTEAAHVPFRTTRCTVVGQSGRDCNGPIIDGCPLSLCLKHLREAAVFASEHLSSLHLKANGVGPYVSSDPEPPKRESCVYYIQFGNRIKIGTTTNLANRLSSLPYDRLLATEPGDVQLERMRQNQFAKHHVNGEWFHASEDLLSHTRMLVGHYGEPVVSRSIDWRLLGEPPPRDETGMVISMPMEWNLHG